MIAATRLSTWSPLHPWCSSSPNIDHTCPEREMPVAVPAPHWKLPIDIGRVAWFLWGEGWSLYGSYLNEILVWLAAKAARPLKPTLLLKKKTPKTTKNQHKMSDHKKVSNPTKNWAVWNASSKGQRAACTRLLHALQSVPRARLDTQILLTEGVRIWNTWGFFLKLLPKGPSYLKIQTSDYPLQPFLPREKIKFFHFV